MIDTLPPDRATRATADLHANPTLTRRTRVVLTDASEGRFGVAGLALRSTELAALRGA